MSERKNEETKEELSRIEYKEETDFLNSLPELLKEWFFDGRAVYIIPQLRSREDAAKVAEWDKQTPSQIDVLMNQIDSVVNEFERAKAGMVKVVVVPNEEALIFTIGPRADLVREMYEIDLSDPSFLRDESLVNELNGIIITDRSNVFRETVIDFEGAPSVTAISNGFESFLANLPELLKEWFFDGRAIYIIQKLNLHDAAIVDEYNKLKNTEPIKIDELKHQIEIAVNEIKRDKVKFLPILDLSNDNALIFTVGQRSDLVREIYGIDLNNPSFLQDKSIVKELEGLSASKRSVLLRDEVLTAEGMPAYETPPPVKLVHPKGREVWENVLNSTQRAAYDALMQCPLTNAMEAVRTTLADVTSASDPDEKKRLKKLATDAASNLAVLQAIDYLSVHDLPNFYDKSIPLAAFNKAKELRSAWTRSLPVPPPPPGEPFMDPQFDVTIEREAEGPKYYEKRINAATQNQEEMDKLDTMERDMPSRYARDYDDRSVELNRAQTTYLQSDVHMKHDMFENPNPNRDLTPTESIQSEPLPQFTGIQPIIPTSIDTGIERVNTRVDPRRPRDMVVLILNNQVCITSRVRLLHDITSTHLDNSPISGGVDSGGNILYECAREYNLDSAGNRILDDHFQVPAGETVESWRTQMKDNDDAWSFTQLYPDVPYLYLRTFANAEAPLFNTAMIPVSQIKTLISSPGTYFVLELNRRATYTTHNRIAFFRGPVIGSANCNAGSEVDIYNVLKLERPSFLSAGGHKTRRRYSSHRV